MAPEMSTSCSLCRSPPFTATRKRGHYVQVYECAICPVWYHYECFGVETEEMPVVTKFVCPKCTLEGKGQCEFAEELPDECLDMDDGDITELLRKELFDRLVSNVKYAIQEHLDELAAELACADLDCKRLGVDEWAGFCSDACIKANMDLVMSKLDMDKVEAKIHRALFEADQNIKKLNADEQIAQKALHEVVHFRQALREFLPLTYDILPDYALPVIVRNQRVRKDPDLLAPMRELCMGFSQKDGKIIPCSKTKDDCNVHLHMMENELKAESEVCGYPKYLDQHFMHSSDPFPDKDALLQGGLCLVSRKVCVAHKRWVENMLSVHELNWMRAAKSLEELQARREFLKEELRAYRPLMDPFSLFMEAVNQLHADTSARMAAIKEPTGDTVEPTKVDELVW